jgi:hypothetical protein
MTAIPKVPNMTLYPFPRERCGEFDKKRSTGRRGRRRPKIWKDSDEKIVRTTPRYDSGMHQMEIEHEKDSLNSIQ